MVYEIACMIFLFKTIIAQKNVKKIIKDLITINAAIASVFCVLNIIQFIGLLVKPALIQSLLNELLRRSAEMGNHSIDKAFMIKMFWVIGSLVCLYAVAILVHVAISFKLLKKYKANFLE